MVSKVQLSVIEQFLFHSGHSSHTVSRVWHMPLDDKDNGHSSKSSPSRSTQGLPLGSKPSLYSSSLKHVKRETVFMSPANYQLWKQIFLLKAHDFCSVQSSQSSPCPGTLGVGEGYQGKRFFLNCVKLAL